MIHIKKSKSGEFFFIIKATNGKTLATSEMYTRKRNCVKGAMVLQDLAAIRSPEGFLSGVSIIDETTKTI